MKASELKVIFDIFIEKLDENKELMLQNREIYKASQEQAEEKNNLLRAIDRKAEIIGSYHPHVTYTVPELENFQENQKVFMAEQRLSFAETIKAENRNFEVMLRRNKDDKTKLYGAILILVLFLFCLCFLSYAISQNSQKNEAISKSEEYKSNAIKAVTFIEDKGLSEKFEKWLAENP